MLTKIITDLDVELFASLSGDKNPLHMSEDFAKKTIFGKKIVHGNFIISLFAGMIASNFPGPGSFIISQEFKFVSPVYVNSRLELVLTLEEYNIRANIFYISALCLSNNRLCVKGVFKLSKVKNDD
jgi:3-hydroxybutyryl-CoA dehydratase